MFSEKELEEIKQYLTETPGRIYLGCDSVKYKKKGVWFARYATMLIVHINDCNGAKLFSFVDKERDFDQKKDKPQLRLMNEVYRVVNLYHALEDQLIEREVEIHLDINSDPKHASYGVMKQAIGYVMGMTGLEAKVKPEAFSASHAADHVARGG